MTRTDRHRPSAPEFDPADYECVGVFSLGDAAGSPGDHTAHREALNDLRARGITPGGIYGSRQCGHCGHAIGYAALMVHEPTGTYLHIGEDCLDNRFQLNSRERFHALRKAAALSRERLARCDRIVALIEDHPLLADLTYPQIMAESSDFGRSIAGQLVSNGRLSARQIASGNLALLREIERRDRNAWRAAEAVSGAPVPVGRITITGEVLTIKAEDDPFSPTGGTVYKMLVRNEAGWRVWGTVPASVRSCVAVGDHVTFTATVQPKVGSDDLGFGYYSRPTQAGITIPGADVQKNLVMGVDKVHERR